ncbi:MAG TPA: Na+/H+ antiporter NhaA [Bryobacteraceae bacterium]|nr:Na+/H+ antiporter NhaA [Bryobacteraceae bacterium]
MGSPAQPGNLLWEIRVQTRGSIAFAIGGLALLGPRLPASSKIFLTALAISR